MSCLSLAFCYIFRAELCLVVALIVEINVAMGTLGQLCGAFAHRCLDVVQVKRRTTMH
jgi:hypothetical protein